MGFYHFTQEVSHAQPFLRYLLIFARVQFLIWRTLPQEVKEEYVRRGQSDETVQSSRLESSKLEP